MDIIAEVIFFLSIMFNLFTDYRTSVARGTSLAIQHVPEKVQSYRPDEERFHHFITNSLGLGGDISPPPLSGAFVPLLII